MFRRYRHRYRYRYRTVEFSLCFSIAIAIPIAIAISAAGFDPPTTVELSPMFHRLTATFGFFVDIARDAFGTLRARWRRFHARVVHNREEVAVGVDVYPFFERMTGVGWYEWNLLAALDRRDDGIAYNLYARTFLAPDDPPPPKMPGNRSMRLRIHQIPPGFLLPVRPTLVLLRTIVEPLLRILDGNQVVFAPNFFLHGDQEPFGQAQVATVHDLAFVAMPDMVSPATLEGLRRNLPRTLYHADLLIAARPERSMRAWTRALRMVRLPSHHPAFRTPTCFSYPPSNLGRTWLEFCALSASWSSGDIKASW